VNTTENKITMRITGNTTMVGVSVDELQRVCRTTRSNRICVSCDAPFFPKAETDRCVRCEQRQSDRLGGLKLGAWTMAALLLTLLAIASRMHGQQQFPVKPAEGKRGQHEALIHTNQIMLGAPANHSAGASVVDDALLNRVAWAESRNNPKAVGKLGEIGAYQLRPIAIREVNRVFGTKYHIPDARKMVESREIARLYLLICESRCRVKTPANVYAKYRGVK